MLSVKQHDSILDIAPEDWDALIGCDHPFLRHAYLSALESSGSIGPGTGWLPRILTVTNERGLMTGALPLYEKHHSNGEFVFDWDWAEAYAAFTGHDYYPKLVSAVPFTPVSGPRLLTGSRGEDETVQAMIDYSRDLARAREMSSLHWLFVTPGQGRRLESGDCLIRTGCHFEWRNPGVEDFSGWLATLSSSRRKSIRRERRRVAEEGIECRWYRGGELDAPLLAKVYELYAANYYAHGMRPYLTPAFFQRLAQDMPDPFTVCIASRRNEVVAGAIFLESKSALYGRYWGALEWIDSLHFEVCYYQGIEHAIQRGLDRFHPGVQGEHKLLRGFEPKLHYSAHWMPNPEFQRAVATFLERERRAVDAYAEAATAYLPYRERDS